MRHILLLIGCLLVTSAWGGTSSAWAFTFKNNTKHDFTLKFILPTFCGKPHSWRKVPRKQDDKPGVVSFSTCCPKEIYLRAAKGDGDLDGVERSISPPNPGESDGCHGVIAEISHAKDEKGRSTFSVEYYEAVNVVRKGEYKG